MSDNSIFYQKPQSIEFIRVSFKILPPLERLFKLYDIDEILDSIDVDEIQEYVKKKGQTPPSL